MIRTCEAIDFRGARHHARALRTLLQKNLEARARAGDSLPRGTALSLALDLQPARAFLAAILAQAPRDAVGAVDAGRTRAATRIVIAALARGNHRYQIPTTVAAALFLANPGVSLRRSGWLTSACVTNVRDAVKSLARGRWVPARVKRDFLAKRAPDLAAEAEGRLGDRPEGPP